MTTPPGRLGGITILGGGTVLAAMLGLGFQALLSYHFGAGAETDAWFMALSVYGFVASLLMLTHLKSIALPVYERLRCTTPHLALPFARRLLGLVGSLGLLFAALLALLAPAAVDLVAPGYQGATRELTVVLLRIRMPALVFLGVATAGLVVLESQRRFGVTVLSSKLAPAAVMLGLFVWLSERVDIVGLGWVGLSGGVAGGLVVLIALRSFLLASRDVDGDPAVKASLREVAVQWIRFGGSNGATMVGEWAFRVAASLLPVGVFSAVLYGRMVHDLMHGSLNDAAQTVSLPRFSSIAAGEARDTEAPRGAQLGTAVRESLAALASVTLPIAVFVALFAPWIIALLFGRGRFLEDGMLGPTAVALRIFAIGFFLQGLNQLLFAAAFAGNRAYLVNRVQMVGHLVRAAALVPAVWAFSFVGLVGAQVGMNVLVLGVLWLFAPREWGLGVNGLHRAFNGSSRGIWIATATVAVTTWAVVARLPDPLTMGTVGRVGVLASAFILWFGTYVSLAWFAAVPGIRLMVAHLRRGALAGAILLFLTASGARAQTASAEPLNARHWSVVALEMLEAAGHAPVGTARAAPVLASSAQAALLAAVASDVAWLGSALQVLEAEVGMGGRQLGGFVSIAWERHGTLSEGAAPGIGVRAQPAESRFFAGAKLRVGRPVDPKPVEEFLVGAHAGPLAVMAGRTRIQLGGAMSGSFVLSQNTPLDGIFLTTSRPVTVPVLGKVALSLGLAPRVDHGAVDAPWFGYVRLAAQPAPYLQLGLSRAALVGGRFDGGSVPYDHVVYGPDERSLRLTDVLGVLVGRTTGFDNQIAAFEARASLASLGLPVLAHLEIGFEDTERSWGDPAIQASLLLVPLESIPLAVRYEYTAFGNAARWCAWCADEPAYWYRHTRFQSGWKIDGKLLGHSLGGYGLQHLLGLSFFSFDVRLRIDLTGGRLRRDQWNLLESDRPGGADVVRLNARYRVSPRAELSIEGDVEEGDQEWAYRRLGVALRWYF